MDWPCYCVSECVACFAEKPSYTTLINTQILAKYLKPSVGGALVDVASAAPELFADEGDGFAFPVFSPGVFLGVNTRCTVCVS